MIRSGISGIFRAKSLTFSGKQKYGIPSKTIIRPNAEIVFPSGGDIIGVDEEFDIELDFGAGFKYVESLKLELFDDAASSVPVWSTIVYSNIPENIYISNSYSFEIDTVNFSSTLNPNSKLEVSVVDEGGFDSSDTLIYFDVSDQFVITNNSIEQEFNSGWHLIGTPVVLSPDICKGGFDEGNPCEFNSDCRSACVGGDNEGDYCDVDDDCNNGTCSEGECVDVTIQDYINDAIDNDSNSFSFNFNYDNIVWWISYRNAFVKC